MIVVCVKLNIIINSYRTRFKNIMICVSFTLSTIISISDIVAVLSFLSIIIGGIFALHKWNTSLKLRRSEYIKELFDNIRTNPQIVFYKFEYDEHWYNRNFHNSGELEEKIDYTLSYFSYICYLKDNKIIGNSEFNYFKYELERILSNIDFKCYMFNIYHFSKMSQQPIPFIDLFNYAKENKYFDNEFWNKNSKCYPRYLNF